MQAHGAAGATRMHITPGILVRFRKQFPWMRLRLFGVCIAATVMMGIGAAAGCSQQPQGKSRELELSRAVPPLEVLPVTGTRAGLLGNESGPMHAGVDP